MVNINIIKNFNTRHVGDWYPTSARFNNQEISKYIYFTTSNLAVPSSADERPVIWLEDYSDYIYRYRVKNISPAMKRRIIW